MSEIAENLARVRARVADATRRSGRHDGDVELMVVSKTSPAEVVQEAVDAGQVIFGENRLQEGEAKIPVMSPELEWHFIGTLQSNKVRKVLSIFPVVHSVSSLKLARFVDRIAGELGAQPKVFLEVNLAGEESKGGFREQELFEEVETFCSFENFDWRGLMAIPPRAETPEDGRRWFAKMRELQEELRVRSGRALPELSMGMSGDYEVAIEEGSTIVRVGSAIFGQRAAWNPKTL
ncbi:YggS family pyridoxal phosphate-dependent enzyme [Akkermansiaceae bacterium]|nr:YggS family pyridoxal phosphate-dependent enzyme [Akkermansiaceae bacterium]